MGGLRLDNFKGDYDRVGNTPPNNAPLSRSDSLLSKRLVQPLVVRPLPATHMRLVLAGHVYLLADWSDQAIQISASGCAPWPLLPPLPCPPLLPMPCRRKTKSTA